MNVCNLIFDFWVIYPVYEDIEVARETERKKSPLQDQTAQFYDQVKIQQYKSSLLSLN